MVIKEVSPNLTEFISMLPPNIVEKIGGFIIILKAVGIALIVYVIYIIVMGFFSYRRMKRMKHIEKKINSMDRKLNILLESKKKKTK